MPMSYLSNILEQPAVVRSVVESYQDSDIWPALQAEMASHPYRKIVLTGMGGSYYALFPTWMTCNQRGLPTHQVEASELVHYVPEMLDEHTLLVVVSQSGESIEIQRLVQAVKGRVALVSVTNTETNFLADHSHFPLVTRAGTEVPVATKTYTGCLALLYLLSQTLTGQLQSQSYQDLLQIANAMEMLLRDWSPWLRPAIEQLQDARFLTLLGRGPAIASAMNGALILKEAAHRDAAGLSGGQFRHGPMEAVSPELGVILFANSGRTAEINLRLAADIRDRGGRVVVIGEPGEQADVVTLALPPVAEDLSPLLEIIPVQLLAAQLAEAAGLVPGEFRWSGKVIRAE
jgi:glutamine---fructose-6-phosphate transaminase (isomerizing)